MAARRPLELRVSSQMGKFYNLEYSLSKYPLLSEVAVYIIQGKVWRVFWSLNNLPSSISIRSLTHKKEIKDITS